MGGPFVQHLCLVGVARHLATVWIMFSFVSLAASTRRGTMTCRTHLLVFSGKCPATAVEPRLRPLNVDILPHSANREDEARLDIRARGFWDSEIGRNDEFFMRIFHPGDPIKVRVSLAFIASMSARSNWLMAERSCRKIGLAVKLRVPQSTEVSFSTL